MVAISERLRSAQEHIRDIAPEKAGRRGFDAGRCVDAIRREFDQALSALPKSGVGSVARGLLTNAQAQLNLYQKTLPAAPNHDIWSVLQIQVQDAVSALGVEVETKGHTT